MGITQCERCRYGEGKYGSILCIYPHIRLDYVQRVQVYGWYCVFVEIVDTTNSGEPWSEDGIEGEGYPF